MECGRHAGDNVDGLTVREKDSLTVEQRGIWVERKSVEGDNSEH